MNTLYLECYSGISGDMTVAALLDLGADQAVLERALQSLPIKGFSTKISRKEKNGLDVCDFHVMLEQDNHDHDMEYLHSHEIHPITLDDQNKINNYEDHQICRHNHTYQQHSKQEHLQSQVLDHHHSRMTEHPHIHRNLSDILSIIHQADMTSHAKKIAEKIFTILGEAEAKAHGTSIENVHFHEVGAVDSIVDIISTAVCLDNLHISDVILPVLQEGTGTIRCQHGILPVPVPATTNIIQEYQIPLQITNINGEFVTPTGAAIAAAIRSSGHLPKQFRILRTGLGAGKRTYEHPSILRAMLIEPVSSDQTIYDSDTIYKLETNIDDCTGEMLGYTMECLMQAGAKDVHFFPVYMKKNRPAYQLNVLCEQTDISKLEQIIFGQTTTIGIRKQRMERSVLPRSIKNIQTIYGEIQVKVCDLNGKKCFYPEYNSITRICHQTGSSYPEIYRKLLEICRKQFL